MNSINEIIEKKKDKFYSDIESIIALELSISKDIEFVRQYPIGKYFADFYFPKYNIVLEIDGHDYHTSDDQITHDRKRDMFMNELKYIVVRVTGSYAKKNPSGVLNILRHIKDINTFFIKSDEDIKNLMIYYQLKDKNLST